MLALSHAARNGGLLALEEASQNLEQLPGGNNFVFMINLILDGTDSYLVEELCAYKYFAKDLAGYQALQYLMMLEGCLAIQAGEPPAFIETRLNAMLA